MNSNLPTDAQAGSSASRVSLKIFGVGGAGLSMLKQIATGALPDAACVAVGTPAEVAAATAGLERIILESKSSGEPGTGGEPGQGRASAEENMPQLKAACNGAEVVFIVAGLGGGAGTGISPVLARVAKEAGALVLAFVTLPFDCEGNRRRSRARHGLDQLKAEADGVICLPNQKVLKLIDDNTSVIDTFKRTGELLADGVGGVWRLLARRGLIEIHFAELRALLRDHHGESAFATAEAAGAARSREVVDKLFAHPMLDGGKTLAESDAVLVSLTGGPDLTMAEVNRVMEPINSKCARAQVLMGAAIDESFRERLAITVIAARRGESSARAGFDEAAYGGAAALAERPEPQPPNRAPGARRHSRFLPPPPALPPEKMEQLMAGQPPVPGRSRKASAKMRQGQLPLEIIAKGRFDKSEPTIHKGEDLDVPTYIRRGVALN